MLAYLKKEIEHGADSKRARVSQGFFKTGTGYYGAGDIFVGLTVPQSRTIAKKYIGLTRADLKTLLLSPIHEERLIALLILVEQFQKAPEADKKKIYEFYLTMKDRVNNWDLVDLSADKIVGAYLLDKPKEILYTLAHSESVWDRRIAMVATYWFIKHNQFDETMTIAEMLLKDNHDLIHKAVGWMLRESGKRDLKPLQKFLEKYYKIMPRTMLRYSIEKFSPELKKHYMQK